MIVRHGKCLGIKLARWGNIQWELWYCPAGEVIKEHIHERCDVHMRIIAGRMVGRIGELSGTVGWDDMFRVFPIPAGVEHDAVVLDPFCIFLSRETWRGEVTSASEDFVAK